MISRLVESVPEPAAEQQSAAFLHSSRITQHQSRASLGALWHLLSLDAPTVAVLWTIFTAAITHTRLPPAVPIAIVLAVWALYASDRLLDARQLGAGRGRNPCSDLEPRHLFHHLHRLQFTKLAVFCGVGVVMLIPLFPLYTLRLYLVEGVAIAGYFLLIHAPSTRVDGRVSPLPSRRRLPKELLVGPFFSAATFIPTVSARPELRSGLAPLAVLFAALCSLNCLYIYAWEHSPKSESDRTMSYLQDNLTGLSLLLLAASVFSFFIRSRLTRPVSYLSLYPLACAGSALLLIAIHSGRRRFSPVTLRASADAALLTPLVFLPFLCWPHP